MENKINVAELLKDCPSGMELDCILFDDVYFDCIDDVSGIIKCYIQDIKHRIHISFNKYGCYTNISKSKYAIFPKGKTTWEGFVPPCKFKDGDVLFVDCSDDEEDKLYQYIFILNKPEFKGKWNAYCHLDGVGDFYSKETYLTDDEYHPRFATEEEKEKLFDAIKANGYKWNAETKTLEKLVEPKFKVGDRIVHKNGGNPFTITEIINGCYKGGTRYALLITQQDNFELVPNKFDINTLKPFDKVLCRDSFEDTWTTGFYSHFETIERSSYYVVNGTGSDQCIPYNEETKHLVGTTDDCNDYYKTWE